jgi:hypothetical protein
MYYPLKGFDKKPDNIQISESLTGKTCILFCFGFLLKIVGFNTWPIIITALSLIVFLPKYRALIITTATVIALPWVTYLNWLPAAHDFPSLSFSANNQLYIKLLTIVFCYIFLLGYLYIVKRFHKNRFLKHPILNLIIIFFVLAQIGHTLPKNHTLSYIYWAFIFSFANLIWFMAYSIKDHSRITTKNGITQLGWLIPFWGSTPTPVGKGSEYLNACICKSNHEAAALRLNALQLLLWALILKMILLLLLHIAWAEHIPKFVVLLSQIAAGHHTRSAVAWSSLLLGFITQMLWIAYFGHVFVASARMAGYKILRNSYRPLSSQTIAEFWSRYYFYFKELLAEFFFYPAYFKFFKKHQKLRVYFATINAVCLGNTLYHMMEFREVLLNQGLLASIKLLYVYILYGIILGSCIALSQWRDDKRKTNVSFVRARFIRPGIVLSFYCFMYIFMYAYASQNIMTNIKFITYLF